MNKLYLAVIVTLFFSSSFLNAHGGRTNKNGCHKQDGILHCHNKIEKKNNHKNKPKLVKKLGVLKIDYEGFSIWLDCSKRSAIRFRYNAQHDTNVNFKRKSSFYFDKKVPKECQQLTTKAYGHGYDRGHLVPANHLDYSKTAIKESNYMINILPQRATMNRGAWLRTEEVIECYRDIDELLIVGGVIYNDKPKMTFYKSHGVYTPFAFYKVVLRGDDRIIAWIVPNSVYAKRSNLNNYLVSVRDIEKIIKEKIKEIPDYLKDKKEEKSWLIPKGCNKS